MVTSDVPMKSEMQVGVEKLTLNGRIRLTLKPLMDEMPIVAAMQVSLKYLD